MPSFFVKCIPTEYIYIFRIKYIIYDVLSGGDQMVLVVVYCQRDDCCSYRCYALVENVLLQLFVVDFAVTVGVCGHESVAQLLHRLFARTCNASISISDQ